MKYQDNDFSLFGNKKMDETLVDVIANIFAKVNSFKSDEAIFEYNGLLVLDNLETFRDHCLRQIIFINELANYPSTYKFSDYSLKRLQDYISYGMDLLSTEEFGRGIAFTVQANQDDLAGKEVRNPAIIVEISFSRMTATARVGLGFEYGTAGKPAEGLMNTEYIRFPLAFR